MNTVVRHILDSRRHFIISGALALGCLLCSRADAVTVTIDVAGYDNTQVLGLNDHDQLVGIAYSPGKSTGFIWENGVISLVKFPGYAHSAVYDINNNGDMVGNYGSGDIGTFSAAFKYTNGVFSNVDIPGIDPANPSGHYVATGINDNQDIVGISANTLFTVFSGAYATPFPLQPSTYGMAINNSGVVTGNTTAGVDGFTLAPNGTVTPFGPPGSGVSLYGINDAGVVLGIGSTGGFMADHGTITPITVSGATFTWTIGINNDKDIVGFYHLPGENKLHGFFRGDINQTAPTVPDSGSLWLLLPVGLTLAFRFGRRR